MYAGTFNTALSADKEHHLFYWLVKNTKMDPPPNLVLWINGGPGATSMTGLFNENGPLWITRTGTGVNDF